MATKREKSGCNNVNEVKFAYLTGDGVAAISVRQNIDCGINQLETEI
jgi:hypothetical protein